MSGSRKLYEPKPKPPHTYEPAAGSTRCAACGHKPETCEGYPATPEKECSCKTGFWCTREDCRNNPPQGEAPRIGDRIRYAGEPRPGAEFVRDAWEERRHTDSIVLAEPDSEDGYLRAFRLGDPQSDWWGAPPSVVRVVARATYVPVTEVASRAR